MKYLNSRFRFSSKIFINSCSNWSKSLSSTRFRLFYFIIIEILTTASRFGTVNYPVDYAINCTELTCQVFKDHHRLCTPKLQDGTYLACNLQFRGESEKSVLVKAIRRMYDLYEPKFTSWIPTPFRLSTSWKPICYSEDSVFKGTQNTCIMVISFKWKQTIDFFLRCLTIPLYRIFFKYMERTLSECNNLNFDIDFLFYHWGWKSAHLFIGIFSKVWKKGNSLNAKRVSTSLRSHTKT